MQTDAFKDKTFWAAAVAVLVAIVGGGLYYLHSRHGHTPEPARAQSVPRPAAADEHAIQHPLEQTAEVTAQPPLNDSDAPLHNALVGAVGEQPIERFLIPQNIVRRIVVTIDNLPRKKVAVELRPVKPTGGVTITTGGEGALTLSADNSARYAPFVHAVQSMDAGQLTSVYFHFYPLFQQAYENLGYPSQYFNDRLVEVIDHLLATPDVQGPIELVQPRVFYEFKDRQLEGRSAGQKLLMRMGSANAAVLKSKLREIRALIVKNDQPATRH